MVLVVGGYALAVGKKETKYNPIHSRTIQNGSTSFSHHWPGKFHQKPQWRHRSTSCTFLHHDGDSLRRPPRNALTNTTPGILHFNGPSHEALKFNQFHKIIQPDLGYFRRLPEVCLSWTLIQQNKASKEIITTGKWIPLLLHFQPDSQILGPCWSCCFCCISRISGFDLGEEDTSILLKKDLAKGDIKNSISVKKMCFILNTAVISRCWSDFLANSMLSGWSMAQLLPCHQWKVGVSMGLISRWRWESNWAVRTCTSVSCWIHESAVIYIIIVVILWYLESWSLWLRAACFLHQYANMPIFVCVTVSNRWTEPFWTCHKTSPACWQVPKKRARPRVLRYRSWHFGWALRKWKLCLAFHALFSLHRRKKMFANMWRQASLMVKLVMIVMAMLMMLVMMVVMVKVMALVNGKIIKMMITMMMLVMICNNPPCIALYKVDILYVYKVGFRSPLYTPNMGNKSVFCAKNMPLEVPWTWQDDLIQRWLSSLYPAGFPQGDDSIYAAMHFIDRWSLQRMAITPRTIHFI